MIQIRRILCPIDFSDFSRRALDHAVAIAKRYDSAITLLHVRPVVSPVDVFGMPTFPVAVLASEDRAALLAFMKRFADAETGGIVPIQMEVAEGDAAPTILERANALSSDLLVMGTHGRSGFEHLVLGSVTEKVLRKATCPVLSVPRNIGDVVPAPPLLFRRIVCAIDFSECSTLALDYAMSLAQEPTARLTLVHVIEVPPEIPPDMHETTLGGPRSLREYTLAAEEYVRARLQGTVPEGVRTRCTVDDVLATGKPYREILRVAEEQESDLIVIGTHGRGPAGQFFFGSTAQHVVRQASCPVLTLRKA